MKVIVHFPKTERHKEEMQKNVAEVHAKAVIKHVKSLTCPTDQKNELLNSIKKKC